MIAYVIGSGTWLRSWGYSLHIFGYLLLLVLSLKYSDIIYVSKDFYINAMVLNFSSNSCCLINCCYIYSLLIAVGVRVADH